MRSKLVTQFVWHRFFLNSFEKPETFHKILHLYFLAYESLSKENVRRIVDYCAILVCIHDKRKIIL